MFLDMVKYSAHMSKNEADAMSRMHNLTALMRHEVADHGGTIVKFLGDGTLAVFPTAIAAVSCAQSILESIRERNKTVEPCEKYEVRVGLHLGDIIEKDNDIFGDTVNISARIQPYADPGGIAMSSHLYLSVRSQLHMHGAYLGELKLKNISERVKIFSIPPPHTSFIPWLIKKRNPVNTRLRAIILAIGVAAVWLFLVAQDSKGAPKAALFYVDSIHNKGATAEDARIAAKTVMEEISARGPYIGAIKWKDNSWVAELMAKEGLKTGSSAAEIDRHAGQLAKRGELTYYLTARIEDASGWIGKNWRVKMRIIDATSQTVVASFSAQGEPAVAARSLMNDVRAWAKKNVKRAPLPAKPKQAK